MATVLHSEVGRDGRRLRVRMQPVPLSPDEVSTRIRRARELLGMSRFDLAVVVGVSPSTIQRWEEGHLPSVNKLVKLAEHLQVPSDYLTEPPERRLALSDLHALLGEVQAEAERGREALLEALASIDARISRIERQLGVQDGLGTSRP